MEAETQSLPDLVLGKPPSPRETEDPVYVDVFVAEHKNWWGRNQ